MISSDMDPIAQIKDKLNIIDVISPYVNLRKRGSNWFGLCPFHGEKTASFSVNEDRGFFHCFGCNESGDIFTFIEKIEHTDFKGALEMLAKMANVDISNATYDKKYNEKKDKLIEINEFSKKFFMWILKDHKNGERGRKYIQKRKINDPSISEFGIGYAPTGYQNLYNALIKKGFYESDILEAGVCIKREKDNKIIDKFRGRLMFPIENISGNTVGFSGRYIPVINPKFEPPKYLNTADTYIFNKGKILYGFNQAKNEIVKKGFVIISEGQINIISSSQVGEKNIVASMGTALTAEHLKLLSRYTKNIYFCFDNDTAGKNAFIRSLKLALQQDLTVRFISLRKGSDPDEEINIDSNVWVSDIDMAKDAFDQVIDEALKTYKSIDDKSKIISSFIDIISACVNPVIRDVFLQKIGSAFDVEPETLKEYFQQKSLNVPLIKKPEMPIPNSILLYKDDEEYTLALLCQNYDVLKKHLMPEFAEYFTLYKNLYINILKDNIEVLIEDDTYKNVIEELLTKNLPSAEDVEHAFNDCIRKLKLNLVKSKINELKKELSLADEEKQQEILQKIDQFIKGIDQVHT